SGNSWSSGTAQRRPPAARSARRTPCRPRPAAGRSGYRGRGRLCAIYCWFCSRCTFLLGAGCWTFVAEPSHASRIHWFQPPERLPSDRPPMDEWIDYYDSTHTIYVSKLHRERHFAVIARDIVGYIASPDAIVLDYACGEALSAGRVADACGLLYL